VTDVTRGAGRLRACAPVIVLFALVLAGTSLAGCGQKGQLYLPSQKKSKVPTPAQQPQATPPGNPQPAPGSPAPS
jgi:predicted small lipoprotein YifL